MRRATLGWAVSMCSTPRTTSVDTSAFNVSTSSSPSSTHTASTATMTEAGSTRTATRSTSSSAEAPLTRVGPAPESAAPERLTTSTPRTITHRYDATTCHERDPARSSAISRVAGQDAVRHRRRQVRQTIAARRTDRGGNQHRRENEVSQRPFGKCKTICKTHQPPCIRSSTAPPESSMSMITMSPTSPSNDGTECARGT